MIITQTPLRISFFGGGTDYPAWYRKNSGQVLSTTIDKYLYISCRYLPPFFEQRLRLVYSTIEACESAAELIHPTARETLQFLNINNELEIHYDGDLPARSGMGSSSCFTVGLINALYSIKRKKISKIDLAKKTINFEQKIMKEIVGSQDQVVASIGGFNKIIFNKNKSIRIKKIKRNKNIESLENNLVLIYTRINRTAHKIASSYVKKLTTTKKNYIKNIQNLLIFMEKIGRSNAVLNSSFSSLKISKGISISLLF